MHYGLRPDNAVMRIGGRHIAVMAALLLVAAGTTAALLDMKREAPQARFVTVSGEKLALADLRGKVVLVNFWATYCASCLREMPKLVETHRKFSGQPYETVAVAVRQDSPDLVARMAGQRSLPFKVAFDASGEIAGTFGGIKLTPTTFVLDKRGRVLQRFNGEPDWGSLHALVERALKE